MLETRYVFMATRPPSPSSSRAGSKITIRWIAYDQAKKWGFWCLTVCAQETAYSESRDNRVQLVDLAARLPAPCRRTLQRCPRTRLARYSLAASVRLGLTVSLV